MPIFKVWVRLEAEYDEVEADNEEDAFLIASEDAMGGGTWDYTVEKLDEE